MATKLIVCAVFDAAVQAYGRPIFTPARGAAVRAFIDEVNRGGEGNAMSGHPEDFEIRLLGEFDEEQGVFFNNEGGPLLLARGKDVVKS